MNNYLFFKLNKGIAIKNQTSKTRELTIEYWTPKVLRLSPERIFKLRFYIWWIFWCTGIFTNRYYFSIVIKHSGDIIHRTFVFPKYFRFAFMGNNDVQIGDLWTKNEYRGKGIAKLGVRTALSKLPQHIGDIWYLCDKKNIASQKLAINAGFVLVGEGLKVPRFGSLQLGYFKINNNL